MADLDAKVLEDLYLSEVSIRKDIETARKYYEGKTAVFERDETYADGQQKSNTVTNWIQFGVDMFVGSLTQMPWQVTDSAAQDGQSSPFIERYMTADFENDLESQDSEAFENSLIAGSHVEVHEFMDGKIVIRNFPREQFAFSKDPNGEIQAAVRYIRLDPGTFFEGRILDDVVELMTGWDDRMIVDYRREAPRADQGGQTPAWEEEQSIEHNYGMVPIIEWKWNKAGASLINEPLRRQVDEYSDIDSHSGDDIRNNTNAKLIIEGCDPAWLVENAKLINEMNMLPLPENASCSYQMKGNDVQRVKDRLDRCKENIHTMLGVPDVQSIAGATGDTSGIALKLRFMPMVHKASKMIKYLKASLRKRIELIAARTRVIEGLDVDSNIGVEIQFTLPVNRIEEWASIKGLDGVVSHLRQLELLSDIDDPHEELERIRAEELTANRIDPDSETPEQTANRVNGQVDQQAQSPDLQAMIEQVIQLISDAAIDVTLRNGVIERTIDRKNAERAA